MLCCSDQGSDFLRHWFPSPQVGTEHCFCIKTNMNILWHRIQNSCILNETGDIKEILSLVGSCLLSCMGRTSRPGPPSNPIRSCFHLCSLRLLRPCSARWSADASAEGAGDKEEREGLGEGEAQDLQMQMPSCSSTLTCCVASCKLLHFSGLRFPHVSLLKGLFLRIK